MLEVLLWVVFGALTGWIMALIVRNDSVTSVLPTVVGAIGALVGGVLYRIYGHPNEFIQVNSFFSAIGGAISLLALVEFVRKK